MCIQYYYITNKTFQLNVNCENNLCLPYLHQQNFEQPVWLFFQELQLPVFLKDFKHKLL